MVPEVYPTTRAVGSTDIVNDSLDRKLNRYRIILLQLDWFFQNRRSTRTFVLYVDKNL